MCNLRASHVEIAQFLEQTRTLTSLLSWLYVQRKVTTNVPVGRWSATSGKPCCFHSAFIPAQLSKRPRNHGGGRDGAEIHVMEECREILRGLRPYLLCRMELCLVVVVFNSLKRRKMKTNASLHRVWVLWLILSPLEFIFFPVYLTVNFEERLFSKYMSVCICVCVCVFSFI